MSKIKTGYEIMNEKVKSIEDAVKIIFADCPRSYKLSDFYERTDGTCDDADCIGCWQKALKQTYEVESND